MCRSRAIEVRGYPSANDGPGLIQGGRRTPAWASRVSKGAALAAGMRGVGRELAAVEPEPWTWNQDLRSPRAMRSATMMVGRFVVAVGMVGMIEASAIVSP